MTAAHLTVADLPTPMLLREVSHECACRCRARAADPLEVFIARAWVRAYLGEVIDDRDRCIGRCAFGAWSATSGAIHGDRP
jgi:hypothetical protein